MVLPARMVIAGILNWIVSIPGYMQAGPSSTKHIVDSSLRDAFKYTLSDQSLRSIISTWYCAPRNPGVPRSTCRSLKYAALTIYASL